MSTKNVVIRHRRIIAVKLMCQRRHLGISYNAKGGYTPIKPMLKYIVRQANLLPFVCVFDLTKQPLANVLRVPGLRRLDALCCFRRLHHCVPNQQNSEQESRCSVALQVTRLQFCPSLESRYRSLCTLVFPAKGSASVHLALVSVTWAIHHRWMYI